MIKLPGPLTGCKKKNHKFCGNLREYYMEESVNYVEKVSNYAEILEQFLRTNWSITQKKIANYVEI